MRAVRLTAALGVVVALGVTPAFAERASDVVSAACAGRLSAAPVGRISSPALDEVSGIAASRRRAGVLWVANDSGDQPRVYAVSRRGRLLQTVAVAGADALDWEDLALGPGPTTNVDSLYAADIGDNDAERTEIAVYRLREPTAGTASAAATRIRLRYPDGAHNAEALLVDPRSGRLLVVTKRLGTAVVYATPRNAPGPGLVTLRRVGSVSALLGPVTGGAVSPQGDAVALRTVLGVALWRRPAGAPLWAAFRSSPCTTVVPGELQGEAVTFNAAGTALFTIAEGDRPVVNEFRG